MNRKDLYRYIDGQFKINDKVNLFYNINDDFSDIISPIRPSRDFLDICREPRVELIDCLKQEYQRDEWEDISRHFTTRVIRIFTYNNQYLYFKRESQEKLKEIYRGFIGNIYALLNREKIDRQDIEMELYKHSCNLCDFLIATNGNDIFNRYRNRYIDKLVCEEYSARLQLKILKLDLNHIVEPILDIGCGESANLVKYLRKLGFDAYGVDRNLKSNDYLILSDWFDVDYSKEYWGTIISHMAFSNHIWHHKNRKDGYVLDLYNKMEEILQSLKIGGRFIYAPSLPDTVSYICNIEDYNIKKVKIGANMKNDRFYTTIITRV